MDQNDSQEVEILFFYKLFRNLIRISIKFSSNFFWDSFRESIGGYSRDFFRNFPAISREIPPQNPREILEFFFTHSFRKSIAFPAGIPQGFLQVFLQNFIQLCLRKIPPGNPSEILQRLKRNPLGMPKKIL